MTRRCSDAENDVLQAGGRAQTVRHGEFRFDTGPSLLLFPDTYRQVRQGVAASAMRSQKAQNDMQQLLTAAGLCQAGHRALSEIASPLCAAGIRSAGHAD